MATQILHQGRRELTKWEKVKKIWDAFLSAWSYILFGLAIGFTLLGFQRLLDWVVAHEIINEVTKIAAEHHWLSADSARLITSLLTWTIELFAFILEHLGIGFIVAAIAVLFYEWGAHVKETVELNKRLVKSLGHAKLIIRSLDLTQRLYQNIDTRSKANLDLCLNTLICGPSSLTLKPEHLVKAVTSCRRLVLDIATLREDGAWGNNKYIEFITKQIEEFVGHNARAFSYLQLNKGKQEFKVPPTAAGMASEILACQMEAMSEGDRYDVISDLTSWQGAQLDKLFNKTEAAVTNHDVRVRRVFNFLPYIWRGYERKLSPDHKSILIKHLRASETWLGQNGQGSYKIKILWPSGYEKIKTDQSVKNINIATQHFGLFIHRNETIKFSVTKTDLSDMELCRQERDNDDAEIFEAVWATAEEFPVGGSIEDRVNRVVDELAKQRGKS